MSQASHTREFTPPPLSQHALKLLSALRRRIRWYVWIEGLAMVVIWLGLSFWVGLAVDYLPVLAGADEMPVAARMLLLAFIVLISFWILWRWGLRRAFCRLPQRSMAMLVERQFPAFEDSLVTSVELSGEPDHAVEFSPQMLAATMRRAESELGGVRLGKVFNYSPLVRNLSLSLVVVVSIVLFGLLARDAFATWTSRLFLLSPETWPRHAYIEVVGFKDGRLKVAKGSDLEVRVCADATRPMPPPEVCTIYYETSENDGGRVNMSRDGEPRDGYQYYVFTGKPFKGILDDIDFDVVGYDCRVRDQRVEAVLSPTVVDVRLKCELPAYTGLLPRTESWNAGTQLPFGTRVTALVTASKDLRKATIENADSGTVVVEEAFDENSSTRREFQYEIPRLESRHTVIIELEDADGIASQEPQRISIGAVADQPPRVNVLLRGIGSAVTPDARIPASGTISDDYEIARSWYDIQVKDRTSRSFPCKLSASGEIEVALDLRDERSKDDDPFELKPDDQIVLSVKAEDRYDLSSDPHVGESEVFELAVVRPDELLAILDGRELGLRRRFEQIISEVTETRDSLARVRASWDSPVADESDADAEREGDSVTDASEVEADETAKVAPEADERDEERARQNILESRRRWVQWAVQHAERSTQEVGGIAASFEDIREELVNNRVDTPERKSRLEEQIIVPLERIADQMFPEFQSMLLTLQSGLDSDLQPEEAGLVVEQADQILLAMDQVLQKMLELEDYAELVNIVRDIIEQQERLSKESKVEQKRRALELLK